MKWRNQLLALICLAIFAALGVFYFQNWVVQKPFAIILFVGEGLTTERLAATRVYVGGADTPLAIDGLPNGARLRNHSADFAVPDSAAAASAIATGAKVRNGAIAVDETGAALRTIVEISHEQGRAVGLVTDGELTNPTLAAFYAHSINAKPAAQFATRLVNRPTVDIALGGGAARVQPKDSSDEHLRVVRTSAELEEVSGWQRGRILGLFAQNDLAFSDDVAARAEQPSLGDMVRRAIQLLEVNRHGYLLVVDAHLMASAAWQNLGERTLRETAELDRAVKIASEYAGNSSTIIVAGDVAIGGMNVNGYPFRYDTGVAILGLNSAGQPWITWATGPNAVRNIPEANGASEPTAPLEPAAVPAPTALNSVEDPIVSASGVGGNKIHGVLDNTALFSILRDAL